MVGMNEPECFKVFAFPTRQKAREMLRYARPDRAGRLFNDAYQCRIPSCQKWHLTTKQYAPSKERRSDKNALR